MRPPPAGSFAAGHVRPPLRQPAPQQPSQGIPGAGPSGLVAGQSGMAGGAAAPLPLQPPARQMGMPTFIPPQQMPYAQYNPQSQYNS
jgi:hypothetical protein